MLVVPRSKTIAIAASLFGFSQVLEQKSEDIKLRICLGNAKHGESRRDILMHIMPWALKYVRVWTYDEGVLLISLSIGTCVHHQFQGVDTFNYGSCFF